MLPANSAYFSIVETALNHLRKLIEPLPSEAKEGAQRFERFLDAPDSIASRIFGNPRIKEYFITICAKELGCELTFVALYKGHFITLPPGFVSWLAVSGEKSLIVFYDPSSIRYPLTSDAKEHRETQIEIFEANKRLGKVLLHECGHAVLHLAKLRKPIEEFDKSGNRVLPSVDPEDEMEAWFYALVVWGVLVGDASCSIRTASNKETAWIAS